MFVRIINRDRNDSPSIHGNIIQAPAMRSDTLYQCDSVRFSPFEVVEGEPGQFILVLEGHSPYLPIEHHIVQDGYTEIYVMNDDGKTIDTYRYPYWDVGGVAGDEFDGSAKAPESEEKYQDK